MAAKKNFLHKKRWIALVIAAIAGLYQAFVGQYNSEGTGKPAETEQSGAEVPGNAPGKASRPAPTVRIDTGIPAASPETCSSKTGSSKTGGSENPRVVRDGTPKRQPSSQESSKPAPDQRDDAEKIAQAFRKGQSDVLVEAPATIEHLLSDDLDGHRHQRLIVRLSNGMTVLIAHNIDLATKVPAVEGAKLSFRGEYEWNDRGGVVHWTHHDPRGRHPGGWIFYRGKRYQ